MKKIILIGDSIRMGYDRYVGERLSGMAEVFYPNENGRFALYVLRYLNLWKERLHWPDDVDLIHWNAGLWDVGRYGQDEPLTPLAFYVDIVRRIHVGIRLHWPKARLVFATSTPVDETRLDPKVVMRSNAEIEAYNAAAVAMLRGLGEDIDDLYATMRAAPPECHSDGTHFYTDLGTETIGQAVLRSICEPLGIRPVQAAPTAAGASSKDIGA